MSDNPTIDELVVDIVVLVFHGKFSALPDAAMHGDVAQARRWEAREIWRPKD